MDKKKFKIAESLSLISNMSLGLYIGIFVVLALWIWKPSATTFSLFMGFLVLSLLSNIINIIFAQKLNQLELKGASKELAKQTITCSYIIFFPVVFAVSCNRFRATLWASYITARTKKIGKESDLYKANLQILDELKADGYISNYKYKKQKDIYEENLKRLAEHKKHKQTKKEN